MSSVPKSRTLKPLALKAGPFQIIEQESLDAPSEAPKRRYECSNYETCLNLAAAMNWDSFTCRGCNGDVNQSYFWRAQQEVKRDKIVRTLCSHIPEISLVRPANNGDSDYIASVLELENNFHKKTIAPYSYQEAYKQDESLEGDASNLLENFVDLFRVAGKK